MIRPDRLLALLEAVTQQVGHRGDLAWQRIHDWEREARIPRDGNRGGGLADAVNDDRIREQYEDNAASRYQAELSTLTDRIDSDLRRLMVLIAIATPTRPRTVASKEYLAAQAAADGWCASCFRDAGHLEPIAVRPGTTTPYYVDRCRACGEWRKIHGEDPPIDVLRTRHRGGRVRVRVGP